MMANLSVPMSVIQRQQMRNFCFQTAVSAYYRQTAEEIISSHTRYASPLSRESPPEEGTKSAMKQRCDDKGNTLHRCDPHRQIPFTIISFIIRPRWSFHTEIQKLSSGLAVQKDSVIWFAWNTGCPLLHQAVSGAPEKNCLSRKYPATNYGCDWCGAEAETKELWWLCSGSGWYGFEFRMESSLRSRARIRSVSFMRSWAKDIAKRKFKRLSPARTCTNQKAALPRLLPWSSSRCDWYSGKMAEGKTVGYEKWARSSTEKKLPER